MNLGLKNQVRWLEIRIQLVLCMCSNTYVAYCEPMVPMDDMQIHVEKLKA
jgi:hypothetical protein